MATMEELENRVRYVESEVEGEKAVTRQVYLQAVRNGDQTGALRSEVAAARADIQALTSQTDHMVGEVVQSAAAVRSHGLRLEALTRDVSLLRGETTALRRGQEELHVRVDRVDTRLDGIEARLDRLETEVGGLRSELGEVSRKLDILIAAVPPRDPA